MMIRWFIESQTRKTAFSNLINKSLLFLLDYCRLAATLTSPGDRQARGAWATKALRHALLMISIIFGVLKRNDQPHTFSGEVSMVSFMMPLQI